MVSGKNAKKADCFWAITSITSHQWPDLPLTMRPLIQLSLSEDSSTRHTQVTADAVAAEVAPGRFLLI